MLGYSRTLRRGFSSPSLFSKLKSLWKKETDENISNNASISLESIGKMAEKIEKISSKLGSEAIIPLVDQKLKEGNYDMDGKYLNRIE
jgi:hypothetical protein